MPKILRKVSHAAQKGFLEMSHAQNIQPSNSWYNYTNNINHHPT